MTDVLSELLPPYESRHSLSEPDWLHEKRQEAGQAVKELGFPNSGIETWKYTSLHRLKKVDFRPAEIADSTADTTVMPKLEIDNSKEKTVIFINGFFREDLGTYKNNAAGIKIEPLYNNSNMLEKNQEFISSYSNDAFAALNLAGFSDGISIEVDDNAIIPETIRLVFIGEHRDPLLRNIKNIIQLGQNAQLRLIEEYRSGVSDFGLTNVSTNIVLQEGATLNHHRLQNEAISSSQIAKIVASVEANASYNSDSIVLGGQLTRLEIDVALTGELATCRLNGLFSGSGEQHIDHHTTVRHQVGDTHSEELYRGILDDKSRGVFNGKVIVEKDAQKITAKQASNNLLLSRTAEIDTKPELQIYADDVKCAHGATIGQLDSAALFYLRSRGISEKKARALLIFAFAEEIIKTIPVDNLRSNLERRFIGHNQMSELKSEAL